MGSSPHIPGGASAILPEPLHLLAAPVLARQPNRQVRKVFGSRRKVAEGDGPGSCWWAPGGLATRTFFVLPGYTFYCFACPEGAEFARWNPSKPPPWPRTSR